MGIIMLGVMTQNARLYGDYYARRHDPKWDVNLPTWSRLLFSAGVMVGHWLAAFEGPELHLLPVCMLYYKQKADMEEALMVESFGQKYTEYASKGRVVPKTLELSLPLASSNWSACSECFLQIILQGQYQKH